jgi:RNA polymerase primary sigma factor
MVPSVQEAAPSGSGGDRLPPLTRREELELIRRAQAGSESAQSRLIAANLGLVYREARRHRCRSYLVEDLTQEGVLGLITAIRRFDPSHGSRLSTYAVHWIRQAIRRVVEYNDRMIHVPAHRVDALRRLRALREGMRQELGREPTEGELADAEGTSPEEVRQLLELVQEPVSLSALVDFEGETSLGELAADPASVDPARSALAAADQREVRRLLNQLGQREREVLEARFGLGRGPEMSLEQLGRLLGLSREGVRQIEVRAIRKLRRVLEGRDWP